MGKVDYKIGSILMDYKADALEFFKGDIFALETTGIKIDEVKPGYAKCRLDVERKHLNARNFVMGGAIFTLADFAMAVAAKANGTPAVSLNLNINYVAPASPPVIFAEAKCVKDGRNICFYEIVVANAEGDIVATASGSGYKAQK